MTENSNIKNEPLQLSLFGMPEPVDIDDSAEREYYAKGKFIEQQRNVDFPDISRVYLPDFIAEIFERPLGDLRAVEPFEERQGERYLKWREEENAGKEHDYSEGQFQYNPIVFYKSRRKNAKGNVRHQDGTGSSDQNTHRLVLKDDWQSKDWLQSRYFALMAPITYVGKSTANKNARYLYAFTIDLDGVGMEQLQMLFKGFRRTFPQELLKGLPIIPTPNIIVNSGHGMHLYYIMRYPLALYEWNAKLLQQISRSLYHLAWYPANKKNGEPGTSTEEEIHCLGIYHMFRMPETMTKPLRINKQTGETYGTGVPIQAWKLRSEHYTLSDFARYYAYNDQLRKTFTPKVLAELERGGRMLDPNRLTLEQARKKYGEEWYQNRDKTKGRFVTNRRLYDWWLKKLRDPYNNGVKVGHRYFCIMALASFAKKCDVPRKELQADAESLLDILDGMSNEPDNHFKMSDINVALKAYDKENSVRWSPRMIQHWTDIQMKETKRNRRKQSIHLAGARAIQKINDPDEEWRKGNGRKHETVENSKIAAIIQEWREQHPDSHNKSECARELGLTRPTVRKWWNEIEQKKIGDAIQEGLQSVSPENPVFRKELSEDEYLEMMSSDFHLTTIEKKKKG